MNPSPRLTVPDGSTLPDRHAGLAGLFLRLTTPPGHSSVRSIALVLGLLTIIASIDYLAGFWVSFQLFYLIPIMLAVTWVGWRFGCIVATLCVSARLAGDAAAGIFEHVQPGTVFWNRLAELAVSSVLVWAFHSLVSLQRELERRVQQRTAALKHAVAARDELQKQLFEVGRRERCAIGRDLHDGLGQHLTATSMAATVLASRLASAGNGTAENARTIVQLIQEAIAKTRDIARGLLLSAVDPADLVPELEELAARLRQEHGLPCTFVLHGKLHGLNVATSSHLFYIAQEAARNAIRHARASRVDLVLTVSDRELVLAVSDDGAGLPPDQQPSGMGLRIMGHRSELIGAEFRLVSAPGRGTTVSCQLPLGTPGESPTS